MQGKINTLKLMIGFLSLIILFHLAILTQLIPYTIVWAGKLKTIEEMYTFESVSIGINVLLIVILLIKFRLLKQNTSNSIIDIAIWLFIVLFALNTIGNLMAETLFEKLVFTPMTLLFAVLLWMVVRKNKMVTPSKDPNIKF